MTAVTEQLGPESIVFHDIYGEGIVESITSSGNSVWVLWEDGELRCHPIEEIQNKIRG